MHDARVVREVDAAVVVPLRELLVPLAGRRGGGCPNSCPSYVTLPHLASQIAAPLTTEDAEEPLPHGESRFRRSACFMVYIVRRLEAVCNS